MVIVSTCRSVLFTTSYSWIASENPDGVRSPYCTFDTMTLTQWPQGHIDTSFQMSPPWMMTSCFLLSIIQLCVCYIIAAFMITIGIGVLLLLPHLSKRLGCIIAIHLIYSIIMFYSPFDELGQSIEDLDLSLSIGHVDLDVSNKDNFESIMPKEGQFGGQYTLYEHQSNASTSSSCCPSSCDSVSSSSSCDETNHLMFACKKSSRGN